MSQESRVFSKDYGRQYRLLWPEMAKALERTFLEDDPILGEAVEQFETALAAYHQTATAVGVSSGMAALELSLSALGVAPGDEVITCAHTFTGVLSAIVLTGAKPVLVDADGCGLLDADAVDAAVTARTKVILAVHLYGHPVDVDRLAPVAAKRGVHLVEDAAQAHGACWHGRPVGGFGVAAALSFHPSKNLGAFGDGGAILTSDLELAARLRTDRNLGKSGKYEFAEVARNSKLDTLQAAVLLVKIGHLETWVERRRQLARLYDEGLADVDGLIRPTEHPHARHAYHLYVIRSPRRDELRTFLAARGIRAGLHYPIAAHRQPAHAARFAEQTFPVAERLAAEVLTLPLSHEHSEAEIARVVDAVRAFFPH
jgi:dTDP-3-amino-3,4,6-trideoxy-alpha-D-glucose transaminase